MMIIVKEYDAHEVSKMTVDEKKAAKVTPHFSVWEMQCKCGRCEWKNPDKRLMLALEKLRHKLNKMREMAELEAHLCMMILVNSAYRCPRHNAAVGGAANSQHLLGKAADIRVKGMSAAKLAEVAEQVPAFAEGGIGLYKTFVHVDVRFHKTRWKG